MNVLSLFSGIGGLDLGLERAGMTVVGQVEIDPWCRTILAKHWPEVPRHDDVRTVVAWWNELVADALHAEPEVAPGDDAIGEQRQAQRRRPEQPARTGAGCGVVAGDHAAGDAPGSRAAAERPSVDVVCGGFPCQPVSVAGKRLAQADDRWLWPAFAQVIRGLRPSYVLVENVPGLLAHGMGDVLGDLAAIGYDAEWDCIPAAFVGAPHIRRRVFIVAYPGSVGPGRVTQPASGDYHHGPHSGRQEEACRPAECREDVADTDRQRQLQPQRLLGDIRRRAGNSSTDVADTGSGRHRPPRIFLQPGRHSTLHHRRWPAEPGVGRVAHGIPRRVDRLRGLGNAVVPQVAEHIGRLIMEASAA